MIKLGQPVISSQAINDVNKVLKSGNLVQSSNVAKFEKNLESYLGVRNVIAVTSGTAALHLAVMSLEIQKDSEIIVLVLCGLPLVM